MLEDLLKKWRNTRGLSEALKRVKIRPIFILYLSVSLGVWAVIVAVSYKFFSAKAEKLEKTIVQGYIRLAKEAPYSERSDIIMRATAFAETHSNKRLLTELKAINFKKKKDIQKEIPNVTVDKARKALVLGELEYAKKLYQRIAKSGDPKLKEEARLALLYIKYWELTSKCTSLKGKKHNKTAAILGQFLKLHPSIADERAKLCKTLSLKREKPKNSKKTKAVKANSVKRPKKISKELLYSQCRSLALSDFKEKAEHLFNTDGQEPEDVKIRISRMNDSYRCEVEARMLVHIFLGGWDRMRCRAVLNFFKDGERWLFEKSSCAPGRVKDE